MRYYLIVFLIFVFYFTNGQNNNKTDFIINNNNDTIFGKVIYSTLTKNPTKITFIRASNSIENNFEINDLIGFYSSKYETLFKRFSISLSNLPIDESENFPLTIEKTRESIVWLQILQDGEIGLGKYFLNKRIYFFILKENKAIELIYGVGQEFTEKRELVIKTETEFKKQLLQYFGNQENSDKVIAKLKSTIYNEVSLLSFYSAFSNNVTIEKTKPINHFTFLFGLSTLNFNIYGSNTLVNSNLSLTSNSSLNLKLSHVYEKINRKFYLQNSIEFANLNINGIRKITTTTNEANYSIKGNNLNVNSTLNYYFVKSKHFKISAGAGFNFSFLLGMKDEIKEFQSGTIFTKENVLNYKKLEFHPYYNVNLNISRFNLNVTYRKINQLFIYANANSEVSVTSASIGYRF